MDIRRHREVGLADRRHESLKVITLIETDSGYGPCDHSHYVLELPEITFLVFSFGYSHRTSLKLV